MKISNVNIENFRNVVRADVDFGNINIFTGKNSSGKSNFLLAISNSLKTGADFSDTFYENIVTFGPGKSKAVFRTTIDEINSKYLYNNNNKDLVFIEPKKMLFENTFNKKSLSPVHHSLFVTGEYLKTAPKPADPKEALGKKWSELENSPDKESLDNQLVYERSFIREKIEDTGDKQVIEKMEGNNHEESEKFFNIFSNFEKTLYSWVDPKMFSSTSIYKYVVERIDNSEVYDQLINFLKADKPEKKDHFPRVQFAKAKFIQLLADVQKDEKQRDLFKKDLKFYTEGLLSDLYINLDGSVGNKGEIIVECTNAPKDIFYLSAGTAVMVYFILLKNWVELPLYSKNFIQPSAMIFDEVDSIIHPSLMAKFTEVLKSLSKYIQLFISTHSPHFIDCFNKDELFWLKDNITVSQKTKNNSISSVYSYRKIIEKLPADNTYFLNRTNSDLFINGLMDSLFPLI